MSSEFLSADNTRPQFFSTAKEAVAHVKQIYDTNTAHLRGAFQAFKDGAVIPNAVSACYPYVAIDVGKLNLYDERIDPKASYGFVSEPGRYSTTLTRPDIFAQYQTEMLTKLISNHQVPVEVGVSQSPIPILYAFPGGFNVENLRNGEAIRFRRIFDTDPSKYSNDKIIEDKFPIDGSQDLPLAHYIAARVDYGLNKLRHYTGTDPAHFQNFVVYTNFSDCP